ncbi:Hemerythrin HHE cation binding domain [Ceratobasidium sp. AG-Ba]|nr:Hemerythrin HHE cation binding domain [Ceratobasidium sp. AG-Ba]
MLSRLAHASHPRLARAAQSSAARGLYLRTVVTATNSPAASSLDYYNEVLVDHNNVRDLLKRFTDAHRSRDERLMNAIANTIVREAALHSDGEEISIYKALDKYELHEAADKDREEHQAVKQAMSLVDSNSTSSLGTDEFAASVTEACKLFLQHAEDEEKNQFKKLSANLTALERAELARDFLEAREMVPSRPHPSAPQGGGVGQKLMGTMVKPFDAAISSTRDFVELKYHHANPNMS